MGKKRSKVKVFTVLWIITAAVLLVVLSVYYYKLNSLSKEKDLKREAEIKTSEGTSEKPTEEPTKEPAVTSVNEPAGEPAEAPVIEPTVTPAKEPAATPSEEPTVTPTEEPTVTPTEEPTVIPEEWKQLEEGELDPTKPIIAFSFDDGPSQYTERILAALEANGAQATFFMVGYNVSGYKDVVKLVYESGNEIGNHTSNHKRLSEQSKKTIKAEVFDNEDLINEIVPVGQILVRPPYGSVNQTVKDLIDRPLVNWSVDSLDWKTRNADKIVEQIKQDARDGYIVLMHDLYETTAEATERILPWLIEQGYQVTTVSKMYEARGEELKPGTVHRLTKTAEQMQ